jgi:hypothetical protein
MSGWREDLKSGSVDVLVFESWPEEGPEDPAETIVPKLRSSYSADTGLRWTGDGDGATLMSAVDRPGNAPYGQIPVPLRSGIYAVLQARRKGRGAGFWIFRPTPVAEKERV